MFAGRQRFPVLFLITLALGPSGVDRAAVSNAEPLLAKELALEAVQLGWLFSAFTWTYVVAQLPGDWLVDRIGARKAILAGLLLWAPSSALMGVAGWPTATAGHRCFSRWRPRSRCWLRPGGFSSTCPAGIAASRRRNSNRLAVGLLSLALFGKGFATLSWTLVAELFPARTVGVAGALFNTVSSASGIVTAVAWGHLVAATGGFNAAL